MILRRHLHLSLVQDRAILDQVAALHFVTLLEDRGPSDHLTLLKQVVDLLKFQTGQLTEQFELLKHGYLLRYASFLSPSQND